MASAGEGVGEREGGGLSVAEPDAVGEAAAEAEGAAPEGEGAALPVPPPPAAVKAAPKVSPLQAVPSGSALLVALHLTMKQQGGWSQGTPDAPRAVCTVSGWSKAGLLAKVGESRPAVQLAPEAKKSARRWPLPGPFSSGHGSSSWTSPRRL